MEMFLCDKFPIGNCSTLKSCSKDLILPLGSKKEMLGNVFDSSDSNGNAVLPKTFDRIGSDPKCLFILSHFEKKKKSPFSKCSLTYLLFYFKAVNYN